MLRLELFEFGSLRLQLLISLILLFFLFLFGFYLSKSFLVFHLDFLLSQALDALLLSFLLFYSETCLIALNNTLLPQCLLGDLVVLCEGIITI